MPIHYKRVHADLSADRLTKYDRGQGEEDTLKRHLANMRLCAALYPLMQVLEVVIRNRVETVLINKYGPNWFLSKRLETLFRLKRGPHTHDVTWVKIQDAISDLTREGYPVRSGRIVASLHLGTWQSFFKRQREVDFYIPNIRQLFPHISGHYPVRRNVEVQIREFRELRNRIAHHEPIMFDPHLMAKHQNLLTLLETFSPESRKWLRATQADRFRRVYNSIFP